MTLLRARKHRKKRSVGRTTGKDTNHRARVQGHGRNNLGLLTESRDSSKVETDSVHWTVTQEQLD